MDRTAGLLQLWDATTDHPRDDGDYLELAARLLVLDEDEMCCLMGATAGASPGSSVSGGGAW
ncbi:hypothetical protein JIX56_45875 [Streptomyces sp. CA-210063]|uniref:hypothetical protein n=1 Tax=Streptomyces sp. CA-210063 TaxID=2801029 RepID=UPI00214CC649|nr:hypothetical protein [Streptomyces sp. CA-210063]UUU36561.1 hypothetical protein JIX56_45875 [Streptomyces sp. CA-210063]